MMRLLENPRRLGRKGGGRILHTMNVDKLNCASGACTIFCTINAALDKGKTSPAAQSANSFYGNPARFFPGQYL